MDAWLIALLATLALFGVAWFQRRELSSRVARVRRRLSRPETPTGIGPRYPIVLVHGLLGFDQLRVGATQHAYFRGVVEHLEALGVVTYRARLPPAASIRVRAEALHAFIESLPVSKVNIIAHSMGGLDARYAIKHLGMGTRVAALVTVGTPHCGTPLADVGAKVLFLLAKFGVRLDALTDLTRAASQAFNAVNTDVPGVFYGSVIASTSRVHPMLGPAHRWLVRCAGENDGLVPASSQEWGVVLDRIEADHWGSVGWFSAFEARAMYFKIIHELRVRGF